MDVDGDASGGGNGNAGVDETWPDSLNSTDRDLACQTVANQKF